MPGIYLHIPFCKQACHYCNFHFSTTLNLKAEMIDAIVREIELTEPFCQGEIIRTIYFGGGTPSLLETDQLKRLMDKLKTRFNVDQAAEVTLEANPDDISPYNLDAWKTSGVNRLSIGIQTFDDAELKWMNRAHNADQSFKCIDDALKAGFENFSVDLIYGSPLSDDMQWERNIDLITEKNIPHISAYALTVEPKTALDKMIQTNRSAPVDPEKQARQFLVLMNKLTSAGYEHYEISNFAKPGMRSRHNSSYWKNEKYYGFGPAAHSFDQKTRKWNVSNNALYIQSLKQNQIPFEEEVLTSEQQLNEYIMTSLRTMEGLDLAFVADRFGAGERNRIQAASIKWAGKLSMHDQHLILNNEGRLFADGIAAELFA